MKRNILYIFIPVLLLSAFLINCSGSSTTNVEKSEDKKTVLTREQQKKKALEFFY
ncbi:MAG: hypothetical protein IPJ23_19495 [Ignavibacteriales bacterium]|nr:hypothetical protein [Ignavibacteriales bacterium]